MKFLNREILIHWRMAMLWYFPNSVDCSFIREESGMNLTVVNSQESQTIDTQIDPNNRV